MKYLKKKPVRDLTGDQYLKLSMAAEDRLIEMSISEQIEGNTGPSYLEELKQLYQKVGRFRMHKLTGASTDQNNSFCLEPLFDYTDYLWFLKYPEASQPKVGLDEITFQRFVNGCHFVVQ